MTDYAELIDSKQFYSYVIIKFGHEDVQAHYRNKINGHRLSAKFYKLK